MARSLFEECFSWGRLGSICGTLAVVILFIGGFATVFSTSSYCWGVAIYMILLSLLLAGLEAPNLLLMCGFKDGLSKRMDWIKGWYRAILYVAACIPLFFCIDVSTVLCFLLLFSSGFFHFLQWLGPRGGHPGAQGGSKRYSDLRDAREDLLDGNDDDQLDDAPPQSWQDQATDAAGKAVAAAAMQHLTAKIAAANPFASKPQASKPVATAEDVEGNPFASPADSAELDIEANPFLELNQPK